MAVNPDPKPGRWLLPLVVLGMMLFTFVFVSRLPGAEPVSTTQPPSSSETTAPTGDTTASTTPTTAQTDPALAAYRDSLAPLATQMTDLKNEMATVNAGWDADPKALTAAETQSRLTAVRDQAVALAASVGEITPPVGLETQHAAVADAANRASAEATNALRGFTSSPGPEERQAAAAAFDAASSDFLAAVGAI